MIFNVLTIIFLLLTIFFVLMNIFLSKQNFVRGKSYEAEKEDFETKDNNITYEINSLKNIIKEKTLKIQSVTKDYNEYEKEFHVGVRYAERIQRSVIPNPEAFKKVFPQSFVYYCPKDIVSGDFYTVEQLENLSVVVVADCTGHGVPGGFLTMFCITAVRDRLSKCYNSNEINTAEILSKLRSFIIASLAEKNDNDDTFEFSDGMDITLVVFNKEKTKINFSLANHNLYVFQGGEIERFKGDRMPVGRHPKQNENYEMQTCDLKAGDMIYFCSDGIQDQIGGPLEQKFMTKRLQKMLGDIAPLDLSEQYQTALKTITEWKDSQEQFDDQTLIGLRI